jgi:hypothetical protein
VGVIADALIHSLCDFSVGLGFTGGDDASDTTVGVAGDGSCFAGAATSIKRTLSDCSLSSEGSRIAFQSIRAKNACKASTTASTSTLPWKFKDRVERGT